MTSRSRSQKGMTLVEVLVAMAILAMTAGAALAMTAQSARFSASVEDRLLARIIADNAVVEALADTAPVEEKIDDDSVAFAGRRWAVKKTIVGAGVDGLYRIDVTVSPADRDQVLARAETLKADRR